MDFFKNFKDKVNERLFASDEEYDEDDVSEEEFDEEQSDEPMFDGDMNPPSYSNYTSKNYSNNYSGNYSSSKYSYSPTGSMNAPEYDFGKKSTVKPPEYNPSASTEKKTGNIYSMNSVKPATKFKLNSITLYEIYGAKEVALLMMEKDTIIIVNFSPLSENQKLRAMDFLDGAKCVTNAILAKLNENIIVFVPESVELCGDFQSQVDIDSLK